MAKNRKDGELVIKYFQDGKMHKLKLQTSENDMTWMEVVKSLMKLLCSPEQGYVIDDEMYDALDEAWHNEKIKKYPELANIFKERV